MESRNPVVKSVIVADQLVSERDQVDAVIAEYFQDVYGRDAAMADSDADILMWTRLEAAAEAT